MNLRTAIRRALIKLGIIKRKPYTCKHCAFVVPLMGTRSWQAVVAYDHFEAEHWDASKQEVAK